MNFALIWCLFFIDILSVVHCGNAWAKISVKILLQNNVSAGIVRLGQSCGQLVQLRIFGLCWSCFLHKSRHQLLFRAFRSVYVNYMQFLNTFLRHLIKLLGVRRVFVQWFWGWIVALIGHQLIGQKRCLAERRLGFGLRFRLLTFGGFFSSSIPCFLIQFMWPGKWI